MWGVTMSNSDIILNRIRKNREFYCDECLQKITGVQPHQQVNIICNKLAMQGKLHRERRICSCCHKRIIVNIPLSSPDISPVKTPIAHPNEILPDPITIDSAFPSALSASQFEERVSHFACNYFKKQFTECALDIGSGKLHRFDRVSYDRSVVIECKSYNWTSGGNYPSGKIATLKEALFYFQNINAEKKILAMHHREFPNKELLADVFYRQNQQLFHDVELWDFIPSENPLEDCARVLTQGCKILRLTQ
jgi:hypothetical protein